MTRPRQLAEQYALDAAPQIIASASPSGATHGEDRKRAVDASRSTDEKSDSTTPHAARAGAPRESAGWSRASRAKVALLTDSSGTLSRPNRDGLVKSARKSQLDGADLSVCVRVSSNGDKSECVAQVYMPESSGTRRHKTVVKTCVEMLNSQSSRACARLKYALRSIEKGVEAAAHRLTQLPSPYERIRALSGIEAAAPATGQIAQYQKTDSECNTHRENAASALNINLERQHESPSNTNQQLEGTRKSAVKSKNSLTRAWKLHRVLNLARARAAIRTLRLTSVRRTGRRPLDRLAFEPGYTNAFALRGTPRLCIPK
ncbi:hypothetical protein FB451DRAFT_1175213 [Mycena latifolia]|nr:hypothetical protein FB451DRAFT_1175213 [Mycena latifolia]